MRLKTKLNWIIASLLTISTGTYFMLKHENNSHSTHSKPIRVAIHGPWVTLHPGLQHTLWADLVLSNQYSALVGVNASGALVPLGAKSWTISDDYRVFTFQIDTSRRYSDGSYLQAMDYKRSWEGAFRLQPMSANSSLQDVLYKIEGFEQFKTHHELSGVQVEGTDKLVVRFKHPFRIALNHFKGNRFSAFKETKAGFIGTGNYIIEDKKEDGKNGPLLLKPNPFAEGHENRAEVFLSVILLENIWAAFQNDQIDVLNYCIGSNVPAQILADSKLTVLPGQESSHHIVYVNGNAGHLFSDPKLRLAVQYLLVSIFRNQPLSLGQPFLTTLDPQVYLPLQPGRLEEQEVEQRIEKGKQYLHDLQEASKKKPIFFSYRGNNYSWIGEKLIQAGISLAPQSGAIDSAQSLKLLYKKSDYDLLLNGFSVSSTDPDGIYHALGKNGAILSPPVYRERVGQLLEEGRKIISQEKLDEHYKEVSRAILTEVPFVHLGFSKSVDVIRNDRIRVGNIAFRRNEGQLDVFQWK
jgi:ABC-type transport system substrate-binding protein